MDITTASDSALSRTDSWINPANQFGFNDPSSLTSFAGSRSVKFHELEFLFRHDWVSRAVIETLPDDATREGFRLDSEDDQESADALLDELTEIEILKKIHDATLLSRLYGGAVIVLGAVDGGELKEELIPARVSIFNFLLVLDRWQVFPLDFYSDPSHPKFGLPRMYNIHPITSGGIAAGAQNQSPMLVIHESRLIRFDGAFLPQRARIRNIGWGDSALEAAYEAIKNLGTATQSGAATLQDFVLKIHKMSDLAEKLDTEGGVEQVRKRVSLAGRQLASHNITVIGEGDELTKLGTPIEGLDDLQNLYVDYVAGASRIPKSRLLGNQSGILGSSSADADIRNWYDTVRVYQTGTLTAAVTRIAELKAIAVGLPTEGWAVEWNSLWQHDDVTKSQIAVNWSQAHANWINAGVLAPEEVADSVFGGDSIQFANITLDQHMRGCLGPPSPWPQEPVSEEVIAAGNEKLIASGPENETGPEPEPESES